MEKLVESLKNFHVSYVSTESKQISIRSTIGKISENIEDHSFETVDSLKTHLAIFYIEKITSEYLQKLQELLANSLYLNAILFCDAHKNYQILKFGLNNHISDILHVESDEATVYKSIKRIVSGMIQKRNQRLKEELNRKLIENIEHFFVLKKNGKPIHANAPMKRFLHTDDIEHICKGIRLKEYGRGSYTNQAIVSIENSGKDDLFLHDTKILGDESEQIDIFFKIDKSFQLGIDANALSKLRFVEHLKNTLITRAIDRKETPIVCVRIENSQKIIGEFGNDGYFDFLNALNPFLKEHLGDTPQTYWEKDYIIFIADNSTSKNLEKQSDVLLEKLFLFKFPYDIIPFLELYVLSVTELTLNDTLEILERLYYKKFQESDTKFLVYHKSSHMTYSCDEEKRTMFYLENVFLKKHALKLLNIYKGLSINTHSKILKIKEGAIYVKTENIQKYVMNIEKSVVLQSVDFPKDMEADVKYIDHEEPFAILTNPRFLDFSANERQHVRVQCDIRIPITLQAQRLAYTGEILDISIQAVAIKYKSRISKNIINTRVKLAFNLPLQGHENGIARMEIEGEVIAIIESESHYKTIVNIAPKAPFDTYMLEYIYARQKELILEIKKLGGAMLKGSK